MAMPEGLAGPVGCSLASHRIPNYRQDLDHWTHFDVHLPIVEGPRGVGGSAYGEVDVYHGRQSYEIGADISGFWRRYAMSGIIRATDPAVARQYRDWTATTSEGVAAGLEKLGYLMKRYGIRALSGDPQFFSELEQQRKSWSEEYALDVLVKQVRPKADEAFRKGDYSTAAELYARIRSHLSPAEIKKLTLAEERGRGSLRRREVRSHDEHKSIAHRRNARVAAKRRQRPALLSDVRHRWDQDSRDHP